MSDVRDPVEPAPGALIHADRDRELAAENWLLSAASCVKETRTAWQETGLALLRCGVTFTAVRIPATVVHAAAETDAPERVRDYLARTLDGPVFADQFSRLFYALVPASTADHPTWQGRIAPDAECLGTNSFLGVPRTGREDPERSRCHWVVPMTGPGDLCTPDAVLRLIDYGRHNQVVAQEQDDNLSTP
ncbi:MULTISPECIES: hypothetical protein [unclassified Streptomyces]|uniref:hypothetical protein n=1 Tax=unclassified Streptomyces TaxID=2593676 RepID=UPI002E179697